MKGREMVSSLSLLLSVKSILAAQIPYESPRKGSALLFPVFININSQYEAQDCCLKRDSPVNLV
jgi:hypothetical protein